LAWAPRPQRHEPEVEESVDGSIDTLDVDSEPVGHASAAVVGRASTIGCESQQEEDSGRVGLEPFQPVVV
jgi:hypothetical protein